METHDIQKYIEQREVKKEKPAAEVQSFARLCRRVKKALYGEWESRDQAKSFLDLQKRAIVGYEKERAEVERRIAEWIRTFDAHTTPYPPWYEHLVGAVYHEIWGLAGLAEWFSPAYAFSSSAKIIGERIFFLEEGQMVLKPQTITKERREQLIRAFLLLSPEERMDQPYYELYLLDGTRVTIYAEPMAKKGQDIIVLRRYIIPILSFEEQAKRNTIPIEAIPLFRYMVRIGFNVVFLGAVRTAKTTFLTTWQSYEDSALEGVMVETDPEIPLHKILPDSPVLQLLADGQELLHISKSLLRSDADYFILAEARDGIALSTAIKLAGKGTKRMKMTFHSGNPIRFPMDAADEILQIRGGNLERTMRRVAEGFDYVFHFIQLADKRQKRLKSVHELCVNDRGDIAMNPMCEYDIIEDRWHFFDTMSRAGERYAKETDEEACDGMRRELARLAWQSPISNAVGADLSGGQS